MRVLKPEWLLFEDVALSLLREAVGAILPISNVSLPYALVVYPNCAPPQLADRDCRKALRFGIVAVTSDVHNSACCQTRVGTMLNVEGAVSV
jgi:hypothetical protein